VQFSGIVFAMSGLILIVEGESETGDILDAHLLREGYRTYRVCEGRAALDLMSTIKPDLIVLDVKMREIDGWEVLAELRRISATPVVVVTALDQDIDRLQGLRLGADDYIVKPFNPSEVAARISAVLRRTRGPRADTVLRVGRVEIDTQGFSACIRSTHDSFGSNNRVTYLELTLTEFRVLAHMANRPNRVFARAELIDACLSDCNVLSRTVDSHVSNLRKKLEKGGVAGMIKVVRGVGYRLVVA
jgi:two-component system, OmpR family, response regulator AdeR